MKYLKIGASLLLVLLLFFLLAGKLLDQEADRLITQLYYRDSNGIIEGMQPISQDPHYKTALVLVHGFQSNPSTWADLIKGIQSKTKVDIYAPLLAFHGKDLKTLTALDRDSLAKSLATYIRTLSTTYQSVTVVGFSLSGALLAHLAYTHALPSNVKVILYNPALYLKQNTPGRRLEMALYSLWRSYSNYALLGSHYPNYASGDSVARPKIKAQKSMQYDVVPAGLQVYKLDLENRVALEKIDEPYDLILSKDDNYVDYTKQVKACEMNAKFCHLHLFEEGKHVIHWSAQRSKFEDLMVNLVSDKR